MSKNSKRLEVRDVTGRDVWSAGDLAGWLERLNEALATDSDMEVPCGACTACCRSAYFIHIAPDERETLARIPAALLVDAPGRPSGHKVMGYDEQGHCPMLIDDRCSIYEHRPRTCRTFDCRVFAATGVVPDEPGKRPVAAAARRWRFSVAPGARAVEKALRAAAEVLEVQPEPGQAPRNATERALRAIEGHEAFLDGGDPSRLE